MTRDGLSFLSFLFPCFWLCAVHCTFAPILVFSHFPNSHFFLFLLRVVCKQQRDKKMVRVSFSLTFPRRLPLFWMIRFRLRSHSSARGFARVASRKTEGSAGIFRAVDWREKLLSVSVCLSKYCGPYRVNTKSRAHGAKVQSIQGRDFRIIHEFVRVNCNHRCL